MTDTTKQQTIKSKVLRGRLDQVRARYDSGAVPPALYNAIKEMEREIAWTEHKGGNGE